MTPTEVNILIQRYLNGDTTPAEERRLALEVQRDDAPTEWRIIGQMLGELTRDAALYDAIMAKRARKPVPLRPRLWHWSAAACIVLAFVISYHAFRRTPQQLAHNRTTPTVVRKPQSVEHRVSPPAIAQLPPSPPLHRQAAMPAREDTIPLQDSPVEPPAECPNEALTQMLLAEITERVIQKERAEEQFLQDIANDIIRHSDELLNKPELFL